RVPRQLGPHLAGGDPEPRRLPHGRRSPSAPRHPRAHSHRGGGASVRRRGPASLRRPPQPGDDRPGEVPAVAARIRAALHRGGDAPRGAESESDMNEQKVDKVLEDYSRHEVPPAKTRTWLSMGLIWSGVGISLGLLLTG